jgi:hypothetical protein
MISFKALLQKFGSKGEKTGWTYIDISENIAQQLKPDCKKSFRVKGKIDNHPIKAIALIPMGDGNFILAVNAEIRKSIKKIHGAMVEVQIEEDLKELIPDRELIACLKDEPVAYNYFKNLPPSHQNWFSNWVKSAKTETTISKRISVIIKACSQKMSFSDIMKTYKEDKKLIQ